MSHPLNGQRILLVEDNPGDANLIMDLLDEPNRGTGRVVHRERLSDAMPDLKQGTADVVLLDLRLPDASGVEGVNVVRGQVPDMPIVVLTGLEDEELALACLSAGAQDYLSKHDVRGQTLRRAIGYAVARAREVALRKRADALQLHLAEIVEGSTDAIFSSDVNGNLSSWNRGAERIFGFTPEEAIGHSYKEIIRASDEELAREQAENLRQVALGNLREVREIVRLRKDGTQVSLSVVAFTLRDEEDRVTSLAAICRDITEKKRSEEELRRRNEELIERDRQMRALANRLTQVREQERTRISREIHDELGQLLTGLKMDLRWVERRLNPDDTLSLSLAAKLGEASKLIEKTIGTVQRIAIELRPSALDALGVGAAIRDEARRFQERSGVRVDVTVNAASEPRPELATEFFRIFQELLTNIARHANATSAWVLLEQGAVGWLLRVEDDGLGLSEGAADKATSLGVLGVRERAASLGGNVTIERGSKRGTVATIRVPRQQGE